MIGTSAPALQTHYDAMWARAIDAVAAGAIDIDPQLTKGPDPRRGLTLIARPGPALAARFDHLLDALTDAEPDQYRCAAADMHVTMLSLITVADHPSPELARLDDYHAAVDAALAGIGPFAIDFTGITVSRAAVVAQGFPRDATLATLRERLRRELHARGCDASLDVRYRLVTAHATLLRFAAPLGALRVDEVELVVNDWYMSSGSLRRVTRRALIERVADCD
jgi:2'-5' RNA ligase